VRPLAQSAIAAARKREISEPVAVLADSLRWRRRLIAALSELDDCAFRMAPLDPAATPAGERQMLTALQTEMSNRRHRTADRRLDAAAARPAIAAMRTPFSSGGA
jgi:hypothetical protein